MHTSQNISLYPSPSDNSVTILVMYLIHSMTHKAILAGAVRGPPLSSWAMWNGYVSSPIVHSYIRTSHRLFSSSLPFEVPDIWVVHTGTLLQTILYTTVNKAPAKHTHQIIGLRDKKMLSPLGTQREDPILQLCLLLCLDVSKRPFLGEWTLYLPNLSPPHCSAKTPKDPRTNHQFTDRLAKKKLFCSNFCNLLHHQNNSKLSLNLQYFACMWLFLVMLHFLENMLETEQIS
jgi:hypothetical protein